MEAAEKITASIMAGLTGDTGDSIVRINSQYVQIPRGELDELHARISQLVHDRGEELLHLALSTRDPAERGRLLRAAIEVNPASIEALIALGVSA